MGWVTISLRKMTLKQRESQLQYRLMQISQERQTLANQSQYTQRYVNAMKQQQSSTNMQQYMDAMQQLQQSAPDDPTSKAYTEYQNALSQASLIQQKQQMTSDSIFQGYEDALMGDVNRRDQQLQDEQTQVETQLKAAQAELESLDQAMDNSIKNSAIKLS